MFMNAIRRTWNSWMKMIQGWKIELQESLENPHPIPPNLSDEICGCGWVPVEANKLETPVPIELDSEFSEEKDMVYIQHPLKAPGVSICAMPRAEYEERFLKKKTNDNP